MFRRYCSKGGKVNFGVDSVRVSNQVLAFSVEVWEKCFSKCPKMALFFEEESNLIGLRGDTVGLAVVDSQPGKPGCYKVVRWGGFVKAIKFNFEEPVMKRLVRSNQSDMWTIEPSIESPKE